MDQKQDELQAAIDNITNASAAVAGSTSSDVVSQIENKVADAEPEIVSAQSAEPAGDKAIKEAEASKIEMTPQKAMYGDPDLDRVKINALNEIRPILEKMKADQGIQDYEFVKIANAPKATLKAQIRIVPIEAVEDFEIDVTLEDSLDGVVIGESEAE